MARFLLLHFKMRLTYFVVDALFIWTAPPPAWNQTVSLTTDPNVQTTVIDVGNGTANYSLRWSYSLLDGQSILLTTFRVGESNTDLADIGAVFNPGPSQSFTIFNANDFPTRFSSLQSNSEYSTLIINMVTERENATFQCKVQVGSKQWAYSIRINVTGREIVNSTDRFVFLCCFVLFLFCFFFFFFFFHFRRSQSSIMCDGQPLKKKKIAG